MANNLRFLWTTLSALMLLNLLLVLLDYLNLFTPIIQPDVLPNSIYAVMHFAQAIGLFALAYAAYFRHKTGTHFLSAATALLMLFFNVLVYVATPPFWTYMAYSALFPLVLMASAREAGQARPPMSHSTLIVYLAPLMSLATFLIYYRGMILVDLAFVTKNLWTTLALLGMFLYERRVK